MAADKIVFASFC